MNILFILTASIAIKKCDEIFKSLNLEKILINCIITENATKMLNLNNIKKSINGKVYLDSSFKKKNMLHIDLTRKSNLTFLLHFQ